MKAIITIALAILVISCEKPEIENVQPESKSNVQNKTVMYDTVKMEFNILNGKSTEIDVYKNKKLVKLCVTSKKDTYNYTKAKGIIDTIDFVVKASEVKCKIVIVKLGTKAEKYFYESSTRSEIIR
jgi:hypothetical protein